MAGPPVSRGFRRLGYDLYYVEDTGDWPYHPGYPVAEQRSPPPGRNQYAINSDYAVAYVAELMSSHGFQDRWCYCFSGRFSRGVTELGCHPGSVGDSASTYARERDAEVETLCDPAIRTFDACHITLISFETLPEIHA